MASEELLTDEEIAELVARPNLAASQVESVLSEVQRSRTLLRRIEWSTTKHDAGGDPLDACPGCGALRVDGQHASGCELAALIGATK